MSVYQRQIALNTAELQISDITAEVQRIVATSKIKTGIVNIFNLGSTATISTIEYENGLIHDFPEMIQKIIPKGIPYKHDQTWGDDNGHSHLRATLMGPSITVPIKNNNILAGTWQQIVHIEFDHRPRKREIIVTIYGE